MKKADFITAIKNGDMSKENVDKLMAYGREHFSELSNADKKILQGMFDAMARKSLWFFAQYVMGFEVAPYQREWYDILQNKLMTDPASENMDDPLIPAPEGFKHHRINLMAPRNHAKSTIFTVTYSLWVLGDNPDIRIMIVSFEQGMAEAFLREIKDVIMKNPIYRRIFGKLFPYDDAQKMVFGEKWTAREITVRRKSTQKDPTVYAVGTGGPILSKRADIVICDDILSVGSTRTQEQRDKVKTWFNSVLLPVMDPTGLLINVGTAWNLEDLIHELMQKKAYTIRKRYKAIQPDGSVLWEKRITHDYLMQQKQEMGSVDFNKAYQNEALDSSDAIFKREWIDYAKKIGKNVDMNFTYNPATWTLPVHPKAIALGVDLAISSKDSSDYTAFAVIAELANGAKMPLWLEETKLDFAATERMIVELANRYSPDIVVVESNGYQAALVRDLQGKTSLPIVPYSTGGEKYDETIGINSLAVEFENHKWILPYNINRFDSHSATIKQVDKLCDGMLRFGSGHTADILMATWFANGGLRQLSYGGTGTKGYAYGSKVDILNR